MAIFFMIHLLYFAQAGLSLLICAVVNLVLRYKNVLIPLGGKMPIIN
jgi:hypothetical protein